MWNMANLLIPPYRCKPFLQDFFPYFPICSLNAVVRMDMNSILFTANEDPFRGKKRFLPTQVLQYLRRYRFFQNLIRMTA